jgi:hypothetical protein
VGISPLIQRVYVKGDSKSIEYTFLEHGELFSNMPDLLYIDLRLYETFFIAATS